MDEQGPISTELAEVLHRLGVIRDLIYHANVERHREAIVREITQAELSVARVVGLMGGPAS